MPFLCVSRMRLKKGMWHFIDTYIYIRIDLSFTSYNVTIRNSVNHVLRVSKKIKPYSEDHKRECRKLIMKYTACRYAHSVHFFTSRNMILLQNLDAYFIINKWRCILETPTSLWLLKSIRTWKQHECLTFELNLLLCKKGCDAMCFRGIFT